MTKTLTRESQCPSHRAFLPDLGIEVLQGYGMSESLNALLIGPSFLTRRRMCEVVIVSVRLNALLIGPSFLTTGRARLLRISAKSQCPSHRAFLPDAREG